MIANGGPASLLVEQMPTVAEQLRQAREATGLEIRQVAEITKLKTDQIRALEEGNYDSFIAAVYLRGSIRTYASLLKLDAARLLTELDAEVTGTNPQLASRTPEEPAPRRSVLDGLMLRLSRLRWTTVAALIVLVVIGVAGEAFYRAWQGRRTADPLKDLSSGIYEPTQTVSDFLPLPTNASSRTE
jgi:cytoskeletal protein RodZ